MEEVQHHWQFPWDWNSEQDFTSLVQIILKWQTIKWIWCGQMRPKYNILLLPMNGCRRSCSQKHDGNLMFLRCFFKNGTGKLICIDDRVNGGMYHFKAKTFHWFRYWSIVFEYDNDPKLYSQKNQGVALWKAYWGSGAVNPASRP